MINRLIGVFTNVLITQFTIAGTNLEHVDNIAIDGEELLLIETPTYRDRGERTPTDILGQTGATVTTEDE